MTGARVEKSPARALRARIAAARAHLPPPSTGFRQKVRQVLVVASASRGGSSLFAELLRCSSGLLHLRGELNPLLVLNGQSFPASGTDSDALSSNALGDTKSLSELDVDLGFECGQPMLSLSNEEELHRFCVELTCRLWMQWPTLEIALADVERAVRDTFYTLSAAHGWGCGRFESAQLFHVCFLQELRRRHRAINPYSYDLDRSLVARYHPDVEPCCEPPEAFVVEEPPFIAIRPWKLANESDLETRPLVIKTPSNAYRLDYLRALFPNARFRLVHLTRNVAASVNGLLDGWHHAGFFSHRVPTTLRIRGYSDLFPAWGDRWWKFDLPPGWRDLASAPLEDVCLFQWHSAHAAVLGFVREHAADYLHIPLESIVGAAAEPRRALKRLLCWLGLDVDAGLAAAIASPPVVMATHPPAEHRWLKRADTIGPLLERPQVRAMMRELGYGDDPRRFG